VRSVGNGGVACDESSLGGESEADDLMAQVSRLEEQGRLVEASNLMARALRNRASGA
jgi:hypothetical protein